MLNHSVVSDFVTPWTVAHQAPVVGYRGNFHRNFQARQEYWSGLLFPTSGDLPNLGIELVSPRSPALAGRLFTTASPGKPEEGGGGITQLAPHSQPPLNPMGGPCLMQ